MTLAAASKLGLRYNAPSSLMGTVVAANGAVVLLLVNKPAFNALPTKSVIAGASDLPNLHRNVNFARKIRKHIMKHARLLCC